MQLKLYGYVKKTSDSRLCQKLLNSKLNYTRLPRCPRERCRECLVKAQSKQKRSMCYDSTKTSLETIPHYGHPYVFF